MTLNQALINELQLEAASTRKMLEAVPDDKFDWKPHEKSMTLRRLATHVAELANWPEMIVNKEELNLAEMNYNPTPVATTQDLLDMHERNVSRSVAVLQEAPEDRLMEMWTLRKGEHIIFQMPKAAVLRGMCYNHTYHHRGQLSVFLRLLDVKVPGIYGPSYDDNNN